MKIEWSLFMSNVVCLLTFRHVFKCQLHVQGREGKGNRGREREMGVKRGEEREGEMGVERGEEREREMGVEGGEDRKEQENRGGGGGGGGGEKEKRDKKKEGESRGRGRKSGEGRNEVLTSCEVHSSYIIMLAHSLHPYPTLTSLRS